ncbi:MAG: sugar ABC transporter substrate-binding protein [Pelagibacteraceae bacterium]|jgi:simple sugar transport system substrate-binding protein|nr:sugar ABC transporter substrate-binding protein [Pelagibacteraceae bacterium]MDP6710559.1 sugar ABC transporter substrate-binding protein [Pelagibacteraceae bacterium]|tara:strand:- start:160 stop:1080 length:921 start_codon:yes stop_codon:yes gene_type:complete
MRKIYLSILAIVSWTMMSVAAFAIDVIVVSHGQANDPFWSVAKNGVDSACKDMKISCKYTAPGTFDMVEMAKLIDNAVSQKPKGIVITLPDAAALGKSVKAAIAAGIPVISMNSGSDDFASLGISAHVGQTEFEAGVGGGQKMKAAGGKKALCVNHEVGNVALDRRCAGFKKGFGGPVEILGTSNDVTEIEKAVAAKLGGVDTILTLGAGLSGEAALKALEAAGKVGKIRLGTFDMSPDMLKAAAAGKVEFLIDQQQYLQGYLPIAIFAQYIRWGTMPAGVVMTGPGFVTPDNASKVIKWAAQGYR